MTSFRGLLGGNPDNRRTGACVVPFGNTGSGEDGDATARTGGCRQSCKRQLCLLVRLGWTVIVQERSEARSLMRSDCTVAVADKVVCD